MRLDVYAESTADVIVRQCIRAVDHVTPGSAQGALETISRTSLLRDCSPHAAALLLEAATRWLSGTPRDEHGNESAGDLDAHVLRIVLAAIRQSRSDALSDWWIKLATQSVTRLSVCVTSYRSGIACSAVSVVLVCAALIDRLADALACGALKKTAVSPHVLHMVKLAFDLISNTAINHAASLLLGSAALLGAALKLKYIMPVMRQFDVQLEAALNGMLTHTEDDVAAASIQLMVAQVTSPAKFSALENKVLSKLAQIRTAVLPFAAASSVLASARHSKPADARVQPSASPPPRPQESADVESSQRAGFSVALTLHENQRFSQLYRALVSECTPRPPCITIQLTRFLEEVEQIAALTALDDLAGAGPSANNSTDNTDPRDVFVIFREMHKQALSSLSCVISILGTALMPVATRVELILWRVSHWGRISSTDLSGQTPVVGGDALRSLWYETCQAFVEAVGPLSAKRLCPLLVSMCAHDVQCFHDAWRLRHKIGHLSATFHSALPVRGADRSSLNKRKRHALQQFELEEELASDKVGSVQGSGVDLMTSDEFRSASATARLALQLTTSILQQSISLLMPDVQREKRALLFIVVSALSLVRLDGLGGASGSEESVFIACVDLVHAAAIAGDPYMRADPLSSLILRALVEAANTACLESVRRAANRAVLDFQPLVHPRGPFAVNVSTGERRASGQVPARHLVERQNFSPSAATEVPGRLDTARAPEPLPVASREATSRAASGAVPRPGEEGTQDVPARAPEGGSLFHRLLEFGQNVLSPTKAPEQRPEGGAESLKALRLEIPGIADGRANAEERDEESSPNPSVSDGTRGGSGSGGGGSGSGGGGGSGSSSSSSSSSSSGHSGERETMEGGLTVDDVGTQTSGAPEPSLKDGANAGDRVGARVQKRGAQSDVSSSDEHEEEILKSLDFS